MELVDLIAALSDPAAYPRPGKAVEVVQTHISVVFLTGDRAYKVKKPVRLWGFLDYGTAELRRHFCEEEVRLNRRLAPEVYLGVVPVVVRGGHVRVGGGGEVVDHAVEMRRLPPGATLRERITGGRATERDVVEIAALLRRFHAEADLGPAVARAGRPVVFARVLGQNFAATRAFVPSIYPPGLHRWLASRVAHMLRACRPLLDKRSREGRIVDGHGDVRAEHAVLLDTPAGPTWRVIDCIEFTTMLRSIDPLSEIAFLSMDLSSLGRRDLAAAFEDAYLGRSRDDEDVRALMPLYRTYRAHVRAKVDAHTSSEDEVPRDARAHARLSAHRHMALAWGYAREGLPPPIVALVGPSGVGKSVLAGSIAPLLDADVIRSDVVRKSLAGLAPTARVSGEALATLYAPQASVATYARMLDGAGRAVASGRPAILDATFLKAAHRAPVLDLGRRLGCPVAFVEIGCPGGVVRERIEARARNGHDPSDATFDVYLAQVEESEPFTAEEAPFVVRHDGTGPPESVLMPLLENLATAAPGLV